MPSAGTLRKRELTTTGCSTPPISPIENTSSAQIRNISCQIAACSAPEPAFSQELYSSRSLMALGRSGGSPALPLVSRSEEHTSELQSRVDLVCRLLLEKKKKEKERSKQMNT